MFVIREGLYAHPVYLFSNSSLNMRRLNTSSRIRWVVKLTGYGGEENAYRILVGKHEGKKPLVRRKNKPTKCTN